MAAEPQSLQVDLGSDAVFNCALDRKPLFNYCMDEKGLWGGKLLDIVIGHCNITLLHI